LPSLCWARSKMCRWGRLLHLSERRNYHLDKKNKDCDIPVAKRAEYRRRTGCFWGGSKDQEQREASEEAWMRRCNIIYRCTRSNTRPRWSRVVRALVKVNAWPLWLRGCTTVRYQWRELCVCEVCLCSIQGVTSILRSRGSCIWHKRYAMSCRVWYFAGFLKLTARCMLFVSGFYY
jgi:hypothetical protein